MPLYGTGSNPITELLINGVWTALSSRPRAAQKITITRGRANEQGTISAQTANFTANNRDGILTNRNPNSAYFRLLPRNTQVRVSAGVSDSYVRMPMDYSDSITDSVSTPDVAALDVVGDMELRADIWPASWRPRKGVLIATKYALTGNQRSWSFHITGEGKLVFTWTTDGTTATRVNAISTAAIPSGSTRLAVKATIDVVNGANKTVEFWYSTGGIDGTYTQLGTSVTTAGTTSIFSSSAKLCIGQGADSGAIFSDTNSYRGKLYKFRMYSGIAGTIVANPDFSVQAIRATSFNDSTGKTWTIAGISRITSDRLRFWGELSAPPINSDTSGNDAFIPVTAAGLLRRLNQGATPLQSPLYRALIDRSLTGLWPMEDNSGASAASNALTGGRSGIATDVTFGENNGLPGAASSAEMTKNTSRLIYSPASSADTGVMYCTVYFKMALAPPASNTSFLLITTTAATYAKINIGMSTTGFQFDIYSSDGIIASSTPVGFGTGMFPQDQWIGLNFLVTTSAGLNYWSARWTNVSAQTFVGIGPTLLSTSSGRISQVRLTAANSPQFIGLKVAFVHTSGADLNFVDQTLAQAANGYLLEKAGARLRRLADEEDISLEVWGDSASTEAMGYQSTATVNALMEECVDVDQGMLGESRDSLALLYRTRDEMENRQDVSLSYLAQQLSGEFSPTEDDGNITNDVTVSRPGGGNARREIATGYMSTQSPPAGIGRYNSAYTTNAGADSQLQNIASWIANRGSVDQARFPRLGVQLARTLIQGNSSLVDQLISLTSGDTVTLTGMPAWMPPDDIALLIQGYTEVLDKYTWEINWNMTPAELYRTGRYTYEVLSGRSRWGHKTSTVGTAFNTSATSISVALNSATPATLDRWTVLAGSFPFDIMVGGERMTVTNITGTTSPQTFTVTRSVNGIVKAHAVGERVQLFRQYYWRL